MRRTRLNSSVQNLRFGSLGNGVTVYGVTREKHGDYLTVAHIDPTGMVKYYVDATPEERAKISEMANKEHNRWVANYNKRPVDSRFEELLDRVGWNDVHKAISKDIKDGYTMDEILDTYMPAVYYGSMKDRGYEYPDGADFNSARRINSSRLPAKTQRAIRHCINSARRRAGLNCNTRYSTKYRVKPNGDSFTLYFISDDGLNNAMFDVDPDFQGACNVEGEILSAESNWEIDSYENWLNSSESRDIYELLRYDAEGSTGVDMHECNEADYTASCAAIEQAKGQLNSARRRAALHANRRLNCGYYYDGEDYTEMGYDKEQDAYYDLPDEMYIFKLDLSQLADLVRDGIVSKHEIHEWIDELSEDWGGMPAWSPAKLIDKFEIQDLTEDEYYTWKDNFSAELARFRDELERRY